SDFSYDHVDQLEELQDPVSIHNVFVKTFELEDDTSRSRILTDLFYYALHFARKNNFSKEQISAFLSILKRVHDMCISTPFANMDETYQYFKALILCHSLSRPPYSLRIFTPDLTKKVTDYIVDTYFRHFKMYKYAFTPSIRLNLKFNYTGLTKDEPELEPLHDEVINSDNYVNEISQNQDQQLPVEEESAELQEVRKLIRTYVSEEIKKIRNKVDEQLKITENTLNEQMKNDFPQQLPKSRGDKREKTPKKK
ncbi:unnamed protein product, partial [Didymodactylos carnosus]